MTGVGERAWPGGVRIGHWSDPVGRTGVTAVVLPPGSTASGEVRGGAPGTREWALLDPHATVDRVDAVVLSGGSAFGLAACDGVVTHLAAEGRGWPTSAGPVPIVVGMVIFDLLVGDPAARPTAAAGAMAAGAAVEGWPATGAVGAGTGATVAKWRGEPPTPAGLGAASLVDAGVTVACLVACNALGAIRDPVAGDPGMPPDGPEAAIAGAGENTTVGVVLTDAAISKLDCALLARAAHDGLARAVEPVHTAFDGDAFVAAATGTLSADVNRLRIVTTRVVEAAVRAAVRS
ncbi:MAG TPA: P1 family peptidase [Acidimicrobiales bacterium]|nr:P1 family peptidase [Acidimicrobiales bacterium]